MSNHPYAGRATCIYDGSRDSIVRSMIYFWRKRGCGSDFYEIINRDYPDETYFWHVSLDEHRAAAKEAYSYLKQSNQLNIQV